jgi:Flp pilus assembly protein TadG
MTRKTSARREARSGRTAVEAVIVLNVLVVLILGVYDHGRLIMVKQLADNAAREGARVAVVSTDPSTGVTAAQIQATTTGFLAGQTVNNLAVQVYQADGTTGANVGAWNAAPFGSNIAVQVDFDYVPLVPVNFGIMPSVLHVTAKSVMRCEAD